MKLYKNNNNENRVDEVDEVDEVDGVKNGWGWVGGRGEDCEEGKDV